MIKLAGAKEILLKNPGCNFLEDPLCSEVKKKTLNNKALCFCYLRMSYFCPPPCCFYSMFSMAGPSVYKTALGWGYQQVRTTCGGGLIYRKRGGDKKEETTSRQVQNVWEWKCVNGVLKTPFIRRHISSVSTGSPLEVGQCDLCARVCDDWAGLILFSLQF